MQPRLAVVPHGLKLDPGGEGHQAFVRMRGGLAYLCALAMFWLAGHATLVEPAFAPAVAYFVFGYLWMWVVARDRLDSERRRAATIALDHILLAYGLYAGAEAFALVVWAPTFATVGYGLRFGRRYALASIVVSTLLLGLALACSGFWRIHWMSALGVIAGNIILPLYAMRLAANIAAGRLEAEQRANALEASAMKDVLTGALNRLGLTMQLTRCIMRGESGFLMYIDLDNFKVVNDARGHAAGDALLCSVVSAVQARLRNNDAIARIGGDEFAVILNGVSASDCQQIAHTVIAAIAQIDTGGAGCPGIGASIGVSRFPGDTPGDIAGILARADEQMYCAKRAGKNRVSVAPGADVAGEEPAH